VRWIASGGGRSWESTGDWHASWRRIAGAAAVGWRGSEWVRGGPEDSGSRRGRRRRCASIEADDSCWRLDNSSQSIPSGLTSGYPITPEEIVVSKNSRICPSGSLKAKTNKTVLCKSRIERLRLLAETEP